MPRAERLKLVVQWRRFRVVAAARRPKLASHCLAAGGRELVGHWEPEHGCRPLLAESFSDPATHAGTISQATHWTLAGVTKEFSQGREDFQVPNGRPKKRWLPPLAPQAYAWLGARELPAAGRGALADRSGKAVGDGRCGRIVTALPSTREF